MTTSAFAADSNGPLAETAAAPALLIDRLSKWYGPVIGLNQVSLVVERGVVGLVGPNGAGKSTLLKIITGQLRPNLGRVRLFGCSVRSTEARRIVGYSPDVDAFYEEMTGREFVRAMLRLSGFVKAEVEERAERALQAVGMLDLPNSKLAGKRLRGCSKGMRQRIKLAQAIAHDPKLLVLDEPLTGLDPIGRREFSELIHAQSAAGVTVILSSHVLAELRSLADRVILIADGRLLADQRFEAFDRTIDDRPVSVIVESPDARKIAEHLVGSPLVAAVQFDGDECTFETKQPRELCDALNRTVRETGCRIDRLDVPDQWAEALFDRADGS
jgi:ABC-2 type transport system ATP-binding protein